MKSIAMILGCFASALTVSSCSSPTACVRIDALARGEISIIGHLGVPIGTVVTVDGVWSAHNTKEGSSKFEVSAVNGTPLPARPVYWSSRIISWRGYCPTSQVAKPSAPNNASAIVFESLRYTGLPSAAKKHLEEDIQIGSHRPEIFLIVLDANDDYFPDTYMEAVNRASEKAFR